MDLLLPGIEYSLNNLINIYEENFNVYNLIDYLLYNIPKICEEKYIYNIFEEILKKLNDNNPILINSGLFIFGSIIESINRRILINTPKIIKNLNNLINKK